MTIANLELIDYFKNENGKANCVGMNMPGRYQSAYAKSICDVAPIKIGTSRYEGFSIEDRICFLDECVMINFIENEKHVLLVRNDLFYRACDIDDNFMNMSEDDFFGGFYSGMKIYVFALQKSALIF